MNRKYVVLLAAVLLAACLPIFSTPAAAALSASSFQAGSIISDSVFTNYNAMSANDIQTFLNSKLPSCDTNGALQVSYWYDSTTGYAGSSRERDGNGNLTLQDSFVTTTRAIYGQRYDAYYKTTIAATPYVCLKDYVENPTNNQNNLQNPGATISGGMSAAQIIADRAAQYHINPQVILTTLQKEQGLVTDDWPWVSEYQEAMGYACPDTPQGCNSTYAGFYKQVDSAAWQFRYYLDHPNAFNYWIGDNVIPYSPSCSGTHVTIQNAATAALYIYTPYQPNADVLSHTNPTGSASGPGTTTNDSCASYGNRNFWWYFNTWFGPSIGDLVQAAGDKTVYLLSGTTAYPIYDVNVLHDFAALGPVRTTNATEINTYMSGSTLGSMVGGSDGTLYLINSGIKLPFSDCNSVADYGYICDQSKIPYLTDGQLTRFVTGPLVTPLLRSVSDPTVYYITGDTKRPIASWADEQAFHISVLNTLSDVYVNSIPFNQAVVYGPGMLVKSLNSPDVYIVKDLNNILPITNFIYPQELGLSTQVRTIISYYHVLGSLQDLVACSGTDYLATNGMVYSVSSPIMADYGFTTGQFADAGSICANLSISSQALDQFIRVSDGTIYYVSSGQKQAFAGYAAYQAHGGTASNTVQVSDFFAGTLPTGTPITQ